MNLKLIEYRNKIITRLRSRVKHFGAKGSNGNNNYYELRLNEIDSLHPEFKGKGLILLKKGTKL